MNKVIIEKLKMNNPDDFISPLVRRHPPYCDCYFPTSIKITVAENLFGLTKCRCGEDDAGPAKFAWQWHDEIESDIKIAGTEVVFHPIYSTGTAIVRGAQNLEAGAVHYWEMRVITPLVGTDVMFGVGTGIVDFKEMKYIFSSALGLNSQSWGYSYNGRKHHNGHSSVYGHKFSQGCIVGIYLDRTLGRLEFFLNRTSLGVAFKNIPTDPNIKLYPMVSSTAARSVIRLMNSTSKAESLQFRAMRAVTRNPEAMSKFNQIPGFRNILMDYWFLAPNVRISQHTTLYDDILDEAVLGRKALRRVNHPTLRDEDIDINDLYTNAHKILSDNPSNDTDSDEEEFRMCESFKEYFYSLL